jgi:WD40 repeat protein
MFPPDGQRLITADATRVRIWAVGGEAERRMGHWSGLPFIAIDSRGKVLATRGSERDELIFWDLATSRELSRLKAKEVSNVNRVRSSQDGRRIIFHSWTDKAFVCTANVEAGKIAAIIPGSDNVGEFDISPDGRHCVTIHNHKQLRIWDVDSGKQAASPMDNPKEDHLDKPRYSPDGRWLVLERSQQHILCEASTGKQVAALDPGFERGAYSFSPASAAFSPDSRYVLTIWNSSPEAGYVWEIPTGKRISTITGPNGTQHLQSPKFSSDGEWICIPCGNSTARIWETATGKELLVIKGHGDLIKMAVISDDKSVVVTASMDQTVRIWDAHSGELHAVFRGHQEPVEFAAFISGAAILSADKKGGIRVWPVDPLSGARARRERTLTSEELERFEVPTNGNR